jgi:hypothetical protein
MSGARLKHYGWGREGEGMTGAGDCDRAFGGAKERGHDPEEAAKEISQEGRSAGGPETIQSSSNSSGLDSSSLRNF